MSPSLRTSAQRCRFIALATMLTMISAAYAGATVPVQHAADGPLPAPLESIRALIMDLVHPGQWMAHGGTRATLHWRDGAWRVELHDTAFDPESGLNPHDIPRDVEAFVRRYRPILDGQPREIVAAASRLGYRDSAEDSRTLALLKQRRITIEFNDTPLSEALLALERQSGLVIEPDWGRLVEVAIAPDSRITLRADDQPIGDVLWPVCRVLGDEIFLLCPHIERGRIVITSDLHARRHTELAVYDVHGLVDTVLRNVPLRPDGTRRAATVIDREGQLRQVIDTLQEHVDPEGWRDLGGDTSEVVNFDEYLFIRTTPFNHRAIMRLLGAMRDANDEDTRIVSVGSLDHRAHVAGIETRVYDVLDLLHAPYRGPGRERIGWTESQHERLTRVLIDVLLDLIEPEHWRDLGGDNGALWSKASMLLVTTTPQNHQRIATLLDAMRRAVKQPRRVIHAGAGDPHPAHEVIEIRLYPIRDLLIAMRRDFDSVHEALWALADWLQKSVDPAGWLERGGDVSLLQEFQGVLIIKSTPENHDAIARALNQLFRSERARSNLVDR